MKRNASRGRTPTLALLALLATAAACSRKDPNAGASSAVPVTVAAVSRREVPIEITGIGHVEPYNSVAIKARVGGEIVQVAFREGQDVARGQLLFQLDPRPFQAVLAGAQANLERDRARAQNAENDAKRYAELAAKDYVTQAQYDQVKTNSAATGATLKADEAAVQNARLQLEYTRITAPIAGRTGNLLVQAGNLVKANDDKPLVVINQIEPVYVSFSVPESNLSEIKRRAGGGQLLVTAAPAGDPKNVSSGKLTFLNNTVDPQTGTILLKGTFANDSRALWPGAYVDVLLRLATEPNAIVVPSQAVQSGQAGPYVYVVKNDLTVESRRVVVSRTQGSLAVVDKGLQPGERVVTDGQLRLSPGTKIEIKQAEGRAS